MWLCYRLRSNSMNMHKRYSSVTDWPNKLTTRAGCKRIRGPTYWDTYARDPVLFSTSMRIYYYYYCCCFRLSLLWDVRWHALLVGSCTAWTLKFEPIDSSETPASNCQPTRRIIPGKRRSYLRTSRRQPEISHIVLVCPRKKHQEYVFS